MRGLWIAGVLGLASPALGQEVAPLGTDQAPGSAQAPAVAHDRAAGRYWDAGAMEAAQMAMMDQHAAPTYAAARVDMAEVRLGKGGDAYHWEGEAWRGDLNRLVLRTRGEGELGGRLESAEVQAIYARAISPWWNLQAGLRQDLRPGRSYATIGVEGLAPYRFDVLVAGFVSDLGQVSARVEGAVDERITRRWVLSPRAELALSAQDAPGQRMGAGLSSAELGLRLRYEVTRKFAPYVGVSWGWAVGRTAAYRREDGEAVASRAVVLGVRGWF